MDGILKIVIGILLLCAAVALYIRFFIKSAEDSEASPAELNEDNIEDSNNDGDNTEDINTKNSKFLIGNEKWVVSVYRPDCQNIKSDEFYLYVLDFIYGDRFMRKSIHIGSNRACKIQLNSKQVAPVQGKIIFDQDLGMVYIDKLAQSAPFTKFLKKPKRAYNPACTVAPFGFDGSKSISDVKIINGLKLYIGEFVLCFEKAIMPYVREEAKEYDYHEAYEIEISENDIAGKKLSALWETVKNAVCRLFSR